MDCEFRKFGMFLLALAATPPAAAQSPNSAPGGAPTASPWDNGARTIDFRFDSPSTAANAPWSFDLILGLPSCVRLQHDLGDEGVWQVEGFLGLEVIFPTSGVGVRRRFNAFGAERDAMSISPGVDVYLLYNVTRNGGPLLGGGPEYWGIFAADVEFAWEHAWSERCRGHCGLKLGGGWITGERHMVLPVVGVFSGWKF